MPTYVFYNKITKKEKEEFMSISEMEQYIKDNKDWNVIPQSINMIGQVGENHSKTSQGFRDILRNIKKKHPLGKGVDKLI